MTLQQPFLILANKFCCYQPRLRAKAKQATPESNAVTTHRGRLSPVLGTFAKGTSSSAIEMSSAGEEASGTSLSNGTNVRRIGIY